MDIFHCACEGGVRYSSRTGTVVLVINNTKSGRPNTEKGDAISFAGRPFAEDQKFAGANKRLREFLSEDRPVFLFEVNAPGQYTYRGPVKSGGEPTVATDDEGATYPVFKLKLYR
ncbi:MAG: hypothetical protein K2H64_12725 [Desulfovibrio sp.]|nr:hypothetical protein [Desulfovibrio sp.]